MFCKQTAEYGLNTYSLALFSLLYILIELVVGFEIAVGVELAPVVVLEKYNFSSSFF